MILRCAYCQIFFDSKRKKKFCTDKCCDSYHSKKRVVKTYYINEIDDELWKDIAGFEGIYQISNKGRVKSLDRYTSDGKRLKSQIIKQSINNKNDYSRILLFNYGKHTAFRVHRLVAEHFISNIDNLPCVNHINGIKTDNSVENLEWCTYSENNKHAYNKLGKKGAWLGKKGINHPRSHKTSNNKS